MLIIVIDGEADVVNLFKSHKDWMQVVLDVDRCGSRLPAGIAFIQHLLMPTFASFIVLNKRTNCTLAYEMGL